MTTEQMMHWEPTLRAMEPASLRAVMTCAAGLHAERAGVPLTSATLVNLDRLVQQADCPPMRWRSILIQTALKYGLTIDDLTGRSREARIAHPRQEAMWRMKHETPMSYPAIGRRLNRDHSTVLHGVKAHQQRLDKGLAE
jgi:chromosomal replication initiation ATPase DnaA